MKINGRKMSTKVTLDRVVEACGRHREALDDPGFCIECGAEVGGVEPDAREYVCECCGEPTVYGAEELLMEMAA